MNATRTCANCGHEIVFTAQKADGLIFSAWTLTNKLIPRPIMCDEVDGKWLFHEPAVSA